MSSRWRIAVSAALSMPSSHRARRSAGRPTARSPPAPPMASGAKIAPCPSLAAMRPAVTAASIRSPVWPRPARLQRRNPMQARVIGWRWCAAVIRSSHPFARSAKRSVSSAMASGSRRSRKATRPASGPGPLVRRRTAHPARASAPVSCCTPDKRIDIQSASRSSPIRSPANQLRSAASIRARRCRQPSTPRRSRSSSAPNRPATRARRAAHPASACAHSVRTSVSLGSGRGPGGRWSGSSSTGPGKNQRSSSEAFLASPASSWDVSI